METIELNSKSHHNSKSKVLKNKKGKQVIKNHNYIAMTGKKVYQVTINKDTCTKKLLNE